MDNIIQLSNVHYNTALEFLNERKITQAELCLEKCLNINSKDIQALNLIGLCHYSLCDFQKANFYWKRSLEVEKQDNLAEQYLEKLNSEEFRSIINKYNEAIDKIQEAKYEEVIKLLADIIDNNKELVEPYVLIGLSYYELGSYDLAREYIKKALDIDKENIKYLQYLDEINSKLGTNFDDNPKQNKYVKYSLLIASLVIIVLSILFFNSQRKYTSTFKSLDSSNMMLSNVNAELDKYKKLNSNLQEELASTNKEKGQIDDKLQDAMGIIKQYEKYDMDSRIFSASYNAYKNKRYAVAIEGFKLVAQSENKEYLKAEAVYFMASSYERVKDYENAKEYYEKYINEYKDRNYYDDSLYNYGLMLYKQGNESEAKRLLTLLATEMPESPLVNSKVNDIVNE